MRPQRKSPRATRIQPVPGPIPKRPRSHPPLPLSHLVSGQAPRLRRSLLRPHRSRPAQRKQRQHHRVPSAFSRGSTGHRYVAKPKTITASVLTHSYHRNPSLRMTSLPWASRSIRRRPLSSRASSTTERFRDGGTIVKSGMHHTGNHGMIRYIPAAFHG